MSAKFFQVEVTDNLTTGVRDLGCNIYNIYAFYSDGVAKIFINAASRERREASRPYDDTKNRRYMLLVCGAPL